MRQAIYDGCIGVEQNDDMCFSGWERPNKDNPIWQTEDGMYIPLKKMVDAHLIAVYRFADEQLKSSMKFMEENDFHPQSMIDKVDSLKVWEEIFFQEANDRGLITKIFD